MNKEQVLEDVKTYEEMTTGKMKKNKWFIDYFAPFYTLYKKDPKKLLSKVAELQKKTKWLNKCTFLSAT
jgi:hypothetical protein